MLLPEADPWKPLVPQAVLLIRQLRLWLLGLLAFSIKASGGVS